jgi:hypothetical protein
MRSGRPQPALQQPPHPNPYVDAETDQHGKSMNLKQACTTRFGDTAIHWIAASSFGVLGQGLPVVMMLVERCSPAAA